MATKKPTKKTPTKAPTAKAPTTTTKKTYVDKTSSYNQELINKAQSYMTGTDYVAGKPVDTSFWGSSGGGGKNTLYGNTGKKNYAGKEFTTTDMNAIAKYVAEQDKLAANKALADAQNAGYNAAMGEVEGMVQSAIAPIQQMYSNMQTQQNTALQNAQRLSADQINNAYNLSARDYYQLYKTQQAKLPENLSKAGVTGGASESAQLKLMNNYSENLYKNEAARNNQLAGVNADYNNQIAENSINAANTMANSYLQLAQHQLAYKRQDEQAEKEAKAEAQAAAEKFSLVSRNNKVRENEAARQRQGYTTTHWTDSDGYYHYQITGKKKTSSSGSSSKKKASVTYSGGSNSGSNSNNTVNTTKKSDTSYNDVLNQARMRLNYKAAGNNRITNQLYGATGALNYIRNSGLSEAQQKKIAQELGLI